MAIEFALFAPRCNEVQLKGNWDGAKPLAMRKDDDGYFRAEVELADGDYEYQFIVRSNSDFLKDQTVEIGDPAAVRLTEEGRTPLIVRTGKPIPAGAIEWQNDHRTFPDNSRLIIYEMHIGDFSGGVGDEEGSAAKGTFYDAQGKVDYLRDLGVTALELMPVNSYPRPSDWGYSQRSVYAVESSYGTPEDLCRFVDAVHGCDIRLIHDGVYNHTSEDAILTQIDYNYWFYAVNPDSKDLQFGPKFNYEYCDETLGVYPARDHVIHAIQQWVRDFHFDGIRFDMTRAIKRFDLLRWFHDEAERMDFGRPFITIAEHLPQDPAIVEPTGPVDAAWHEDFRQQVLALLAGAEQEGKQPDDLDGLARVLDPRNEGYPNVRCVVNYLDNHDHDRLLWTLTQAGVFTDIALWRRAMLGASILLTAPGIPMIWMGQEFGVALPKNPDRQPQPLSWSLLTFEPNRTLLEHYKRLIRLRRETPALTSDTIDIVAVDKERGLLAFKRWTDDGSVVLVLINTRDEEARDVCIAAPGIPNGVWQERMREVTVTTTENTLTDSVPASAVNIYIKAA
jgi:1,4-alpha-glucan branching enzyme